MKVLKKSGIKIGDIITKINNFEILDKHAFQYRIATGQIGKYANFDVISNGKTKKISIRMIAPPNKPKKMSN